VECGRPYPSPILTTPQLEQHGLGFSGYYFARNNWPPAYFISGDDTPAMFWKPLPAADSEGYVELGITVEYRLHKINNNLDAISDGNPVTGQPLPFPLLSFAIHDDQDQSILSPTAQVTNIMPTLTIAQRACTPYNNTVKLPPVNEFDLNQLSIGDSLPPTDFWIEMRCPTNIGRVGYYFTPPSWGLYNEAQGVININPASQAKGIGLQITTRTLPHPEFISSSVDTGMTYQPIRFGPTNRYRVHSSSPWGTGSNEDPLTHETEHKAPYFDSTNPADSIPLRVAIYRTGTIVPGTYNAVIFIHLVYQ